MQPLNPFEVPFSGVHLIEASAGTGKTYNIESLYVRAIIEAGKTVDEILVVTYTKAATKELHERLMKRLRQAIHALNDTHTENDSFLRELQQQVEHPQQAIQQLKAAARSFDEAAVYTIHGFCQQALQEFAFESGAPFEAELIGDDTEITAGIINDYWRKWVREASESTLRRPLLKLLIGKKYNPEALTEELAHYAGKPYLNIQPENLPDEQHTDQLLYQLSEAFDDLKALWKEQKEEIYALLRSEQINGNKYSKNHLATWMVQMTDLLNEEVAPIQPFEQFDKFCQSTVNDSLKKSTNKPPPRHAFFKKADEYQEIAAPLQRYDAFFKRRLFTYLLKEADVNKEEMQVYSYDDLLTGLQQALCHPQRGGALCEALRRRYPVALVDEFQDTDPVQYEIFKTIYAGTRETALFMIGDPKQSIYSFRGADVFTYLQAKREASRHNIYSLQKNYRSVRPLNEAINALFGNHDHPFLLEDIPYQPVQTAERNEQQQLIINERKAVPLEIRQLTFTEDEGAVNKGTAKERSAADAAAQIKKMLIKAQDGKAEIAGAAVQAGDIAVLVRSHHQAALMNNALKKEGIKSVRHSRESVFHTEAAHELYVILKAVAEPADERRISTALATTGFGYTANEIFALKEDEPAWAAKLQQFANWYEMWQSRGFARMFRTLMPEEKIAETVIKREDGERQLTNLIHLSELIQDEEKNGNPGIYALLKWLLKKCGEDDKESEEAQLRLESDENLVNIVTTHYSKGLEYPIVFCPFLWSASRLSDNGRPLTYHDQHNNGRAVLDFMGKADDGRGEKRYQQAKEALAESVRLAYVAVTRARYKCVINWVHTKKTSHSPLGFLLLGEEEAFESLAASIYSGRQYDGDDISLFQSSINRLAKSPHIAAPVITGEDNAIRGSMNPSGTSSLEARMFHRSIPLPEGPALSSFSSLTRSEHEQMGEDFYQYYDDSFDQQAGEQPTSSFASIFDFPKGPNSGTAVHHIFENIDFRRSEGWDEVISEQLRRQNIAERWKPAVKKMLQTAVHKRLIDARPGLTLAALQAEQMVAEMEFQFTTGQAELSDLLAIIRPDEPLPGAMEGFAGEGFLKGFIDLTFRFEDTYYILDYKTNYLGDAYEDYSPGNLGSEIKEKLYDLQYHLYLVALHRFLEQRIPNYNYKQHIGGAIYLFVRGLHDGGEEGLFFNRPKAKWIHKLNEYLSG
jgi:exodeoxyribonuclease V beta subunit